jgi:hypothetical protein
MENDKKKNPKQNSKILLSKGKYRTHNNGLILVEGLWKVSRQVFTVSSHSRPQLGKWFESTRFRGIEYVGIIWIV